MTKRSTLLQSYQHVSPKSVQVTFTCWRLSLRFAIAVHYQRLFGSFHICLRRSTNYCAVELVCAKIGFNVKYIKSDGRRSITCAPPKGFRGRKHGHERATNSPKPAQRVAKRLCGPATSG